MWYCVAVVLLMWAPVEDWEVADGSLDSMKGITGSEFLFARQGNTDCCRHYGVDLPDCPGGEYGLCPL